VLARGKVLDMSDMEKPQHAGAGLTARAVNARRGSCQSSEALWCFMCR